MPARHALVFAAGALAVIAGCASRPAGGGATATVPSSTPFPTTAVAYAIGDPAGGGEEKIADVFDPATGTLLGRFATKVPNLKTNVGQIVLGRSGKQLLVTAYDREDPVRVHSGVYACDLGSPAARYLGSLGSGVPVDATIGSDDVLEVLVTDPSAATDLATNRIVSFDLRTGLMESHDNPLPARAAGRPTPIAIVSDAPHHRLYVTDERGAVSTLQSSTFRYLHTSGGANANFTVSGGSIAFDRRHGLLYQLGILTNVDEHQRPVQLGALLTTSLATGDSRMISFPYQPAPGAVLNRAGTQLFFGSLYARSYGLTRIDLWNSAVRTRGFDSSVYRPEFVNSGKLAFSHDGASVLLPVAVPDPNDPERLETGAMLQFDPATLALRGVVSSPDDFRSGGVVSN